MMRTKLGKSLRIGNEHDCFGKFVATQHCALDESHYGGLVTSSSKMNDNDATLIVWFLCSHCLLMSLTDEDEEDVW